MCDLLNKLFLKLFQRRKITTNSLPTMLVEIVISELEYDILIHEYWACKVTEEPEWETYMGNYHWHVKWIEVYENTIYYLKGGS